MDTLIAKSMGGRLGNPSTKSTLQYGSRQPGAGNPPGDSPDTFNWFTVYNCRRHNSKSTRATFSSDVLVQLDAVWEIWRSDLNAAECPLPKTDDILTDNTGQQWSVIEVPSTVSLSVFQLPCRKKVGYGQASVAT